ncbi:hypothetical protein INT43_005256 [Umbelopsis isabellina]|uniref:Histone chaperone RTT106/FACT complex subunit SPT16-like middle domain-containing protein n=1 Tax=Mortierella isabellina TaxID=91625 RepID=A0A8H7PIF0_MORIS|nr:hypothetical protein INT43_005256 [Umbelopsis isabellina]
MTAGQLRHVDDSALRSELENLIVKVPESEASIERLINYFLKRADSDATGAKSAKRSLDDNKDAADVRSNPKHRIEELSFTSPERKKMELLIGERYIIIQNYKSQFEQVISINDLDTLVCVPTPEKAKPVYTFILFYKSPEKNAIVFTLPNNGTANLKTGDSSRSITVDEACDFFLTEVKVPQIVRPDLSVFVSIKKTPTGQRQENFGVKAYRKTSEGYLFFLPGGIFYGFKKPTLFFRLSDLYTSSIHDVTQRTFNLTLTMSNGKYPLGIAQDVRRGSEGDEESEEGPSYEFSMLDQTEYGVIDAYIKKHRINDNSMSEQRKAPLPKLQPDELGYEEDEEGEENGAKAGQTQVKKPVDDDDDENDNNFQPSDSDDDALEYDSQASDNENENDHGSEEEEAVDSDHDASEGEATSTHTRKSNAEDMDELDELDE